MKKWLQSMVALTILFSGWSVADPSLTVYSSRKEHLIKPLLDQFSERYNIKIDLITGKDVVLIERMKRGTQSVDVLLLSDVGNLGYAAQQGVLAPFKSTVVSKKVPEPWRASKGKEKHFWTGLSLRARTIVYSRAHVKPSALSTYADLASSKWKGKLCLRTSQKVYNKSLVSSLMVHHGEKGAEQLVKGWVDNLATKPFAKDSQVIKAIAAGQCRVGIVNTYYLGRSSEDIRSKVGLFWANQKSTGVHVNLSGAGVGSRVTHKAKAVQLIEWLLSKEVQAMYAEANKEFPVIEGVALDSTVQSWGDFRSDQLPLDDLIDQQLRAVELMRRTQYK